MEKITNVEILSTFKPQRIYGGTYIEFLSSLKVLKDDYFKTFLNDKEYSFIVTEIRIDGENLLVKCKEVGYWCHKTDRHEIDIRDLVGLTVIPIKDEKEIEKIKRNSNYC